VAREFSFLEFFAGGGMARLGLSDSWRCLFANDFDAQKCAAYRANFGGDDLVEADIASLGLGDLPAARADLMWGSFPCQDLSLAGARGGIKAERSGAFFAFWRLVEKLHAAGRSPRMIVLENVPGLLTSNKGQDFAVVVDALTALGYRISALVLDAAQFTPQSRPRLFILGFDSHAAPQTASEPPSGAAAPPALIAGVNKLSRDARKNWLWLSKTPHQLRNIQLADMIDWNAGDWHSPEHTKALLAMMSTPQRARLDAIIKHKARRVGAAFRRTRIENGETVQRLEARFDGLAGCLRTPAGGSSRQIVIIMDKGVARTRLMSPCEAARLMGLPEDYVLPERTTAALKLCGDGVCVPVVGWLAENILEPALRQQRKSKAA